MEDNFTNKTTIPQGRDKGKIYRPLIVKQNVQNPPVGTPINWLLSKNWPTFTLKNLAVSYTHLTLPTIYSV